MIKYFFSIILFYFLTLFQISFLAGRINLVFFLVIIWNILEEKENNLGIFNALIAGFFLDIFLDKFIGFNIIILVIMAFLIKYLIRQHVRIPFFEKI